jgi:hypothetical protein
VKISVICVKKSEAELRATNPKGIKHFLPLNQKPLITVLFCLDQSTDTFGVFVNGRTSKSSLKTHKFLRVNWRTIKP